MMSSRATGQSFKKCFSNETFVTSRDYPTACHDHNLYYELVQISFSYPLQLLGTLLATKRWALPEEKGLIWQKD
jgi:hypothetical protein